MHIISFEKNMKNTLHFIKLSFYKAFTIVRYNGSVDNFNFLPKSVFESNEQMRLNIKDKSLPFPLPFIFTLLGYLQCDNKQINLYLNVKRVFLMLC